MSYPLPMSNNPFINTSGGATHVRYPSIEALNGPQQQQQPQYTFQPQQPTGFPFQQSQQQQYISQPSQLQPLSTGIYPSQYTSYPLTPQSQFQSPYVQQQPASPPSLGGSYFGSGPMSPVGGYPQQASMIAANPSGFGMYQQQLQQQPLIPDLNEFDPISRSSSIQSPPPAYQPTPSTMTSQSPSHSRSTSLHNPSTHPRAVVRSYKSELESWDTYAWKQALNSFDDLRISWEKRRTDIAEASRQMQVQAQMGYPGAAEEASRLQGLWKEAGDNIDTITASQLQMQEVYSGGYRHSADAASKRRVRDCLNAGLTGLPDWP